MPASTPIREKKRLDELNEKLDASTKQVMRLLERFGISRLDVKQIQNRIQATQGPRKKALATTAQQIGKIVQGQKTLFEERKRIVDSFARRAENCSIAVRNRAYLGVSTQIGDKQMKISDDTDNVRFIVRNDNIAATVYDPKRQAQEEDLV